MPLLLLLSLPLLGLQKSHSTKMELLSKALDQFQEHTLVFHYSNTQLNDLEHFLQLVAKENRSLYLINYDEYPEIFKLSGNQLLHIVFLEEPYYLDKYDHYLDHQNIVMMTSNTHMNESHRKIICQAKSLHRARAVFVFGLDDGRFSTCCYYCGKERVSVKIIQGENKPVPELGNFVNNFKDFGGYKFKIGYNIYPPFLYICK